MAEYGRPFHPPADSYRNRSRSHVPCPRCRIDPSHVSRQYRENIRPSVMSSEPSDFRSNGYPDLCPPRTSRSPPQQQIPPNSSTVQTRGIPSLQYIHPIPPRSTDSAHSIRTGDTWRIRGVLESHQPDVTRRTDSSPGPLPDVTRHGASSAMSRTAQSRVGYEPYGGSTSRAPSQISTRIPLDMAASSYREFHPPLQNSTPERNTSDRGCTPQWKREHQFSNPWVSRGPPQHTDRPSQDVGNLPFLSGQQPSTAQGSPMDTWRPASSAQNVLSQCPLPDLVTPRRQARKQCCGLVAAHSVAVRWLVIAVAVLGLLCSIVGTVVGVIKATGREHLTVSLLLIVLGIVLVSMSGVAWRLTARDAPSCRAMFGLRRTRHEHHRRFVPRVPHYGRPHPFSAMLYPDIPLRPPPPSYQASMQEYRLRLLFMDRQQLQVAPPTIQPPLPPPPPSYRGPATVYPRFPVNIGTSDYSRPPSYRSRPSSAGQPSPVRPDDVTPEISLTNDLNADVSILTVMSTSASTHSSSQLLRPTPSAGNNNNHIEVVAQV